MNEKRNRMIFRYSSKRDELGELEEFTRDLYYVARTDEIDHLTSEGLARIGTKVEPGMLLIGILGQKKNLERVSMNKLERLIASEDEIRDYDNKVLYDASTYAPDNCYGKVVAAYFQKTTENQQQAIVEIEL